MSRVEIAELVGTTVREVVAALIGRHPPALLSREEAAQHVGVSTTLFDAEVAAGIWPQPIRRGAKGTRPTWAVAALNDAAAKLASMAQGETPKPTSPNPKKLTAQQLEAFQRLRSHHA
jgi:hypothetical protein